jgi:hypothetical protein
VPLHTGTGRLEGGRSRGTCSTVFGTAASVTILMVADPGNFAGQSEAHYFLEQLEDAAAVPPGTTMCQAMVRGWLLGQAVAVVTTGIGQRSAASCTTSLLTICPRRVKEVIFFGTAGCSVQQGGVLNSDDCSAPNPSTQVNSNCEL